MLAVRQFAKMLEQRRVHAIRQDETELMTTMEMHIIIEHSVVVVIYHDAMEQRREHFFAGDYERIADHVAELHKQAYPLHSCAAVC